MRTAAYVRSRTVIPVLLLIAGLLAATLPAVDAQELPPPKMHAVYQEDHSTVLALDWVEGTDLMLTVDRELVEVYSETGIVDSPDPFGNITQHWFMRETDFRLARGDLVTITGGGITKTHQVTDLTLDYVDLTADMVHGTSSTATEVCVAVFTGLIHPFVCAPVIDGAWVADFSGLLDITTTTRMGAFERDEDGDATQVDWIVPRIVVGPDSDIVGNDHRSSWTPGATISLTIEDGNGVIYTDSQIADLSGWFNFNLGGVFDVQRGHIVTVSDGTTTKTHAVTNLYVDGIDVAADTVFGRADAGTELGVWVPGELLTVTADSSGNWTADFSAITDLTYTSNGSAQQFDDDGDATWVPWAIIEVDVGIDIKPDSDTNPVNLKSKGVIPVAILTTDDFDAATVDPTSVGFGPARANEAHGRGHFSDVDGDGDIDLMLHFRTHETGIQAGDTEACLTAQTFEGQTIVGCDLINTR